MKYFIEWQCCVTVYFMNCVFESTIWVENNILQKKREILVLEIGNEITYEFVKKAFLKCLSELTL